jgi:thioredoxin reductase (NADPH)
MRDLDLVIVGAGAAGLTAAMVAGQHGLDTVVIEQLGAGGQIINAERIENFPGLPQGIAGHELGPLLHGQAEAAGAEFLLDTVTALEADGVHRVVRALGETLRARAVIVAAGSTLRPLGVPGEERLLGRGVSHCASCDGALFAGRSVCVIGGGDSALDEALVLAAHAARVTVVHRGAALDAQHALQREVAANRRIEVVLGTVVEEVIGDAAVTGVRLRDLASGGIRVLELSGMFVYVGLEPNTAFLRGVLALDAAGHIETDSTMATSLSGVFAAGDIRRHSVALLAAAVGDGATAAVSAARYLTAIR